jgi:hypothetical protein
MYQLSTVIEPLDAVAMGQENAELDAILSCLIWGIGLVIATVRFSSCKAVHDI